jgi:hypothetical protein
MNTDKIRQLCDEALSNHDFGEGVTVEATSGWEYDGSNEVTCPVFLRFDEDEPDDDSHRATFSVTVIDGKVTEATCSH